MCAWCWVTDPSEAVLNRSKSSCYLRQTWRVVKKEKGNELTDSEWDQAQGIQTKPFIHTRAPTVHVPLGLTFWLWLLKIQMHRKCRRTRNDWGARLAWSQRNDLHVLPSKSPPSWECSGEIECWECPTRVSQHKLDRTDPVLLRCQTFTNMTTCSQQAKSKSSAESTPYDWGKVTSSKDFQLKIFAFSYLTTNTVVRQCSNT